LTERTNDVDAVAASIGKHLRSLRQARGWSLDELAQRSGVSKGMVVQIEGARTNPSIATLCRLAEAFGVTIGRFIEASTEPAVRVIRADEPAVLWSGAQGGSARLLRGLNDPAFVELWQWRMMPGEHLASGDHAPGTREVAYVYEGGLTIVIDSIGYEVQPGETIDFHADRPHEYRPRGADPCVFTLVVVMPPGEYDRAHQTFSAPATVPATPPPAPEPLHRPHR
jgi:transcriptional regulator with XRE-family HTH domain